MNSKRILLTTTSSLDGWTVQEYLGPVSTEVVVGTGLFTDFFSSWTDFFGMESRSHQSKLDQIKERALATIEYKALRLGANAVIGLRVDNDEIGAGGKSLLMVTAMGTAIRAHRTGQAADTRIATQAGTISSYELNLHRDRMRLLKRAEAGQLDLGESKVWDFIVDNKVVELAPRVLERALLLHRQIGYDPNQTARAWAPLKEYFFRIGSIDAAEHLYGALARSEGEAEFALQVIREASLLDLDRVIAMLQSGDRIAAIRALQVVQADKPFYSMDDVPRLEALCALIPSVLTPIRTIRKKGLMGEKEVWPCECGETVDPKSQVCGVCSRDRFGIPQKWIKPAAAVSLLMEKVGLLRAQFPDRAALPP